MIVAISMFRDEADIAAATVLHLFEEGVDRVLVADNLSTDGTGEIVRDCGADVVWDPDPGYRQAEKMSALAVRAYHEGATWVLPFDADEFWYSPHGPIGDVLPSVAADVIVARGWDHIATVDDPPGHPFDVIHHRSPHYQLFPKVCFRAHPDVFVHQGNHNVDHPGERVAGVLEYRHFQYRSVTQMIRKVRQGAAAYQSTDLPETEGAHWRALADLDDIGIAAEWARLCQTRDLVYDPIR